MKKKVLAAILCVAMVASMMIGCTTKSPTSGGDDKKDDGKGGKKIGITIQNYENAYWAGVMSKLEPVSYTHLDVYKRQDLFFPDVYFVVSHNKKLLSYFM